MSAAAKEQIETSFEVISASMNEHWRNSNYKVFSKNENRELTYQECYDREISQSHEIFEQVNQAVESEISPQKYILFVDMANPGSMGNAKRQYIDLDRLQKMFEAETGSSDITQDFQSANMRHCFGFMPDDARFRTVKPFEQEMPDDLSDCVGVILSGSETNIKDESDPERSAMTAKVLAFIHKAKDLQIPMFGICFGSQLLNSVFRAKVDWIQDVDTSERKEETGLVLLTKTEIGKTSNSPLQDLPDHFYVHANHKQEVLADSMPENLEVLAKSDTSQVQIVRLKNSDMVWAIQNHIECGDTRADVIHDMAQDNFKDPLLFQGESVKARRVLCPYFIKICGKFSRQI